MDAAVLGREMVGVQVVMVRESTSASCPAVRILMRFKRG